jgi:phage/plasmid-like protein (TIGR03299 family)
MAEVAVPGATVPQDATVETRPDLFGVRGQFRPDGNGGLLSRMQDDRPEYATPEASGVNTGFYVGDRGLPWHVALSRQLGTPELMQDAGRLLTAREAYIAAGGFQVEKVPAGDLETGIAVPGKFVTRRADTKAPLGIVGRGYQVFQEDTLAEFGNVLVDDGQASYETGGHMRGGAWFFLSMELNHLNISVPGDPSALRTYLLLNTSHDGSKQAGWFLTHVREVCQNTEKLARAGAVTSATLRHTGSLDGKVAQMRTALGIAFNDAEMVKEITGQLSTATLVDSQVREIFAKEVWPVKASEDDEANERVSRHADRAFENYLASETLEGIRGTAWGAYNAITEYLDHEVTYRGGPRQGALDARADSLLFGSGSETKDRALTALLAASK